MDARVVRCQLHQLRGLFVCLIPDLAEKIQRTELDARFDVVRITVYSHHQMTEHLLVFLLLFGDQCQQIAGLGILRLNLGGILRFQLGLDVLAFVIESLRLDQVLRRHALRATHMPRASALQPVQPDIFRTSQQTPVTTNRG